MDSARTMLAMLGLEHLPLEIWWRYRRRIPFKTAWNDRHRAFFIHIPKTAGTSIYDSLGMTKLPYTHAPARIVRALYPREFADYFIFTVVRDPWDRFVSTFEFLRSGTTWPQQRAWAERHIGDQDFAAFTARLADDRSYRRAIMSYNFFFTQHYFTHDAWGRLIVDRAYRFEQLRPAYQDLAARFGVSNGLDHRRASGRTLDFRDYYDERSQELVARLYARDIAAFGYTPPIGHQRSDVTT